MINVFAINALFSNCNLILETVFVIYIFMGELSMWIDSLI